MNGANCSQAVFAAFADVCGMSEEQALVIASGFGGGIGRLREVCGAVSGMVLVLNCKFGSSNIADKTQKDAIYGIVQQAVADFKAETGTIICRELLGLAQGEKTAPISEPRSSQFYKKRPCIEMVALAVRICERMI